MFMAHAPLLPTSSQSPTVIRRPVCSSGAVGCSSRRAGEGDDGSGDRRWRRGGLGSRDAVEEIMLDGAAVTAGLVDAHMRLESTKLWIDEFVRTVSPLGDHGGRRQSPRDGQCPRHPRCGGAHRRGRPYAVSVGVCASSCVPASPFESPGAELFAPDVATLLDEYAAIGVAEVMNFPGVIAGDPEMLARIATAGRRRVDGHGPGTERRPAGRLSGRRGEVRPRMHGARRGRRETTQGNVDLHPAGIGQPEPA